MGKYLPDYYRILEVDPKASKEVIDKAYRVLSLKHHPDKNPADKKEAATRKWMEIREAYEVLSDSNRRSAYDVSRKREIVDIFLSEGLLGLARKYLG
ncbi:MAG TPA: DnaJ domain-containing protein [Anaerolineae bacterium]|nr:DnaJ domain-containing protein [Anaerolineae bacterium]